MNQSNHGRSPPSTYNLHLALRTMTYLSYLCATTGSTRVAALSLHKRRASPTMVKTITRPQRFTDRSLLTEKSDVP